MANPFWSDSGDGVMEFPKPKPKPRPAPTRSGDISEGDEAPEIADLRQEIEDLKARVAALEGDETSEGEMDVEPAPAPAGFRGR